MPLAIQLPLLSAFFVFIFRALCVCTTELHYSTKKRQQFFRRGEKLFSSDTCHRV